VNFMAWTEERVKKLTLLWKSGNSASKIAIELGEGVSRNAVIGKIHRLGLSERGSGSNASGPKIKENKIKDKNLPKNQTSEVSDLQNSLEASTQRSGKKRGRKPSIKKLTINENQSILGFNADENSSLETGEIETEIDKLALKNMKEIEKKAKKLNLLELTEKTCKWPIGDPATSEFWFCGHPSEQGKPYCETHISIAFQPITTRRDKKQNKINN
jgi:GcrA cell cycle regulator